MRAEDVRKLPQMKLDTAVCADFRFPIRKLGEHFRIVHEKIVVVLTMDFPAAIIQANPNTIIEIDRGRAAQAWGVAERHITPAAPSRYTTPERTPHTAMQILRVRIFT